MNAARPSRLPRKPLHGVLLLDKPLGWTSNDALQKYRAAFDMAARYTYLAATAYDYDTNLLRTDSQAGGEFLGDIVRERSLGQILDGEPVRVVQS